MNHNLYTASIQLIKDNQSTWGSYVASPAFPTYRFCWLRDGSFTAHAMDIAGEFASAAAFFRWVGRTICKYGGKVEDMRRKLAAGTPIGKDDALHTRFSLDGSEVYVDDTWGNFQIDGYGTWVWALAEHVRLSGDTSLVQEMAEPLHITLEYLKLAWRLPNYDCWEEHPEYLHPHSLGSVYAGFRAAASLERDGLLPPMPLDAGQIADEVKDFILKYGVEDGRLVKHICPGGEGLAPAPVAHSGVDASLTGLAVPYGVLPPGDPLLEATLQAVEDDLHRASGGVYRFRSDVYYGGGEWVLLAGWLGWCDARRGRIEQARELCAWMESCADASGFLPEQVSEHLLAPEHYRPWVEKWGEIAKPLLWSHAMYIILVNAIRRGESR